MKSRRCVQLRLAGAPQDGLQESLSGRLLLSAGCLGQPRKALAGSTVPLVSGNRKGVHNAPLFDNSAAQAAAGALRSQGQTGGGYHSLGQGEWRGLLTEAPGVVASRNSRDDNQRDASDRQTPVSSRPPDDPGPSHLSLGADPEQKILIPSGSAPPACEAEILKLCGLDQVQYDAPDYGEALSPVTAAHPASVLFERHFPLTAST